MIWALLNLFFFALSMVMLIRGEQYEFAIVLTLAAVFCVLAIVPQYKRDVHIANSSKSSLTLSVLFVVIAVSLGILIKLLRIELIETTWNLQWITVGGMLSQSQQRLLAVCTLIGLSGLLTGLKDEGRS